MYRNRYDQRWTRDGLTVRAYHEFPGLTPPVLWMLDEIGARRVAIDTLDAALLGPARQKLERLDLEDHAREERSVKSEAELALTREAARFADQVLKRLLANGGDIIAQGGTEVDLLKTAQATFVNPYRMSMAKNSKAPKLQLQLPSIQGQEQLFRTAQLYLENPSRESRSSQESDAALADITRKVAPHSYSERSVKNKAF